MARRLLTALYAIVNTMMRLEDENEQLQDTVADLTGVPRARKATARMRAAGGGLCCTAAGGRGAARRCAPGERTRP